ncbi:Uncharacterised protein g9124 [Pycnogonum litorale]
MAGIGKSLLLLTLVLDTCGAIPVSVPLLQDDGDECREDWDGRKFSGKVIKYLRGNKDGDGEEIDPLKLDNKELGFNKKILVLVVHGEAKLYNGYIQGLSNVSQDGDVKCIVQDDRTAFYQKMKLPTLKAAYTGHVRFMGLGPSITVSFQIFDVNVHLKVTQKSTDGSTAHLETVNLTSGQVKIRITGLSIITSIISLMTSIFSNYFKEIIHSKLEPAIKKFLAKFVSKQSIKI